MSVKSTFLADPVVDGMPPRAAAKVIRRTELLRASAKIMADKGFHAMRLEDLGDAVGISGPAVYRHFSSKEEILSELMLGISEHLLAEARQVIEGIESPREQVEMLIDYHISFAMYQPELIRLHNRELFRLEGGGNAQVRRAQGHYLQLWARCLEQLDPALAGGKAKVTAQLITGLINSAEYLNVEISEAVLRSQIALSARAVAGLRG